MSDAFFSIGYFILGIMALLLGKFLSNRFLLPQKTKYKVLDEKRYLKSFRLLLYILGFYYIVLGIVVIFIKNEPSYTIYIRIILPYSIYIPMLFIWKKHIRLLSKGL